MNECEICKRQFIYERKKGGTKAKCNTCSVNNRRFQLRAKIIKHMGGKCVQCGYSKCVKALHAHHVDSSTKSFNISGAHCRSWKSIVEELTKCILLCANCHAEEHDLLRSRG